MYLDQSSLTFEESEVFYKKVISRIKLVMNAYLWLLSDRRDKL